MARPRLLQDSAIHAVIETLARSGSPVSGRAVRDELQRRHGHRGGVTRIYRLLKRMNATEPPSPAVTATLPQDAELQKALAAALDRARLAEHREETHQMRWAGEIHALREQVQMLKDASHRLRVLEGEVLVRSRELAAAYRRISDLESQLLALERP